MAKATYTEKNLTFSFENTEFTDLDVLADVDMRQGTPVDETDGLTVTPVEITPVP